MTRDTDEVLFDLVVWLDKQKNGYLDRGLWHSAAAFRQMECHLEAVAKGERTASGETA